MFTLLKKILKTMPKNKSNSPQDIQGNIKPFSALEKNLKWFKESLYNSNDLQISKFANSQIAELKGALLFLDGLVDEKTINDNILSPLLRDANLMVKISKLDETIDVQQIDHLVPVQGVKVGTNLDQALMSLLRGDTIVILDGVAKAFSFSTKGGQQRTVSEPKSEQVVRGPMVAFVESLSVNVSLIRRYSKDRHDTFLKYILGQDSQTRVALVYNQQKVIKPALVELTKRLEKAKNLNRILDTGILEQYLEDNTNTLFPQMQYTERPDKVAAGLAEGRIAILVDGSPNALIVPAPLSTFFQSTEDYYERWQYGTFLRITRFISAFISTSLPAIYIAITAFHPEFLPTNLAFSIGTARLPVPFPAFLEAIMMEFILEVLQEAGIRLPKVVGQTVSIVGGLVIGQAAVQAGIVSPIMIIVIAITAISSFVIPSYNFNITTRLLRVPYMIAATLLGYYGLMLAWLLTLIHLCQLQTMGTNYMEGITPANKSILDTFIRAPIKALTKSKL